MQEQERVKQLANEELTVYPYSVLIVGEEVESEAERQPYPKDVDPKRREYHLSDEEFKTVFKMTKNEFEQLAMWRRNKLKKEHQLF